MEGPVSKRVIISLVVLLMVVLAQAEGQVELANDHHPAVIEELCAAKCTAKCALKIFPKRVARCFGPCVLDCYKPTSEVVHHCTSNCVNSMINAYNPTDVADVEKVEGFVGSCYETCKNNNNN
ncbi:hypothetical protein PTKIN_Ptkin04bG0225200 [Pterospermum kingtungense]